MKIVHVFSGGLDSTVTLHHFLKQGFEVRCINFSYGSKHNVQERFSARVIAKYFDVPLKEVELPFIGQLFNSALLKNDEEIPEGHYADDNMKKTVVPFRNGIMIAIAIGYAESIGFDAIGLGVHAGDHTIYPDCRPPFINAMQNAALHGTWKTVNIITPFIYNSKTQIAKIGASFGLPLHMSYSCYNGGVLHCGVCGACNERKEAFRDNNIPDPTVYLK
jgi:7-cyano-7-deazaguanine synthase